VFLGKLHCLGKHAAAFELRRCQYDLGAQESHHLATLDAKALGHRNDQGVAFLRAHHGEADAGIAAGRLDNCLARLQGAILLRLLDDIERQAVLDRSHRIERLDLDEEIDALGGELVQPYNRRPAYGFEYVFVSGRHVNKPFFICYCFASIVVRDQQTSVGRISTT